MQILDATNGAVLVGTPDTSGAIASTVVETAILSGATILTSPLYVPREAESVSFEIHATSTSGTPTLTVKVRSGNRAAATMVDRAITSPSALASISGAVSAVITVPADTNYFQLQIDCTGGNATVSAIGAARDSGAASAASGGVVSGTVAVSNFPATQAVSAVTLPLPSGAATAAKQPALGTAGASSADVLSVQGIASGTAMPVSAAALPLPSGAATAAKQPALGTAGASSADVLSVQGVASGTAMPVSAASLPLPSGAATAAKQPALGTAGTPSADVITVQGAASGTALPTAVASVAPPSAVFADVKNVTTAGVRVALGSSQALKRGVLMTARLSNTGSIYVGAAATVSSAVYGKELKAGDAVFIEVDNLNLIGLDAVTNGEGVSYLAS